MIPAGLRVTDRYAKPNRDRPRTAQRTAASDAWRPTPTLAAGRGDRRGVRAEAARPRARRTRRRSPAAGADPQRRRRRRRQPLTVRNPAIRSVRGDGALAVAVLRGTVETREEGAGRDRRFGASIDPRNWRRGGSWQPRGERMLPATPPHQLSPPRSQCGLINRRVSVLLDPGFGVRLTAGTAQRCATSRRQSPRGRRQRTNDGFRASR
jgi:hypothetical protein